MKLITLSILAMCCAVAVQAQEVTLFDKKGKAIAYIDYEEEASIFLFDGTPVAFLERDGEDVVVWGYNGKHLGWYEDGILYDKKGYIAGGREDALTIFTQMEPFKQIQRITPIRPITSFAPFKPILSFAWSGTPLIELLYFGKL